MLQWIKSKIRSLGSVLEKIGALGGSLFGLISKAQNPNPDWPNFINIAVEVVQKNSVVFFIGMLGCVIVGFILTKINDQWVLKQIQFILDEHQKKAFLGLKDASGNPEPLHHHKVTLFKKTNLLWWLKARKSGKSLFPFGSDGFPWDGWLIPYKRSGYTDQNPSRIFRVNGNDADNIEGVAGRCWATKQGVVVRNLPFVGKGTTNDVAQSYADQTFVNVDYIKKGRKDGKSFPRSIGAIPVEVKNELWGIVVIDSRLPEGVTNGTLQDFTLTVALIGRLLERVR